MLQANRFYIKTVVDIHQQILAGGGEMHSDCEAVLLNNGSQQQDIWGASWNPISREIFYESMVNLRPRQNRSMEILDRSIREQVQEIIHRLLGSI
jgi:carbonic anhydrase